jgi:nucleotide-binding universal stress UspA family protein
MVVCVDGTDASEQALPHAAAWARALGMSLTLLTVIEDVLPPIRPTRDESRFEPHADADEYIDHLVQQWRGSVPAADGQVLRDPIGPASAIRTYLSLRPAGLVALTTHARSGMKRVRLGATAATIVHASVAPCVVAPVRT